jgi:hypothetical protein
MAAATEQRIALIERFVRARKAAQKDPVTMVELCVGLLKEPLLEDAIRSGDCLAMLVRKLPSPFLRAQFCVCSPRWLPRTPACQVEHYHAAGNLKEAFTYLREMEDRSVTDPMPRSLARSLATRASPFRATAASAQTA